MGQPWSGGYEPPPVRTPPPGNGYGGAPVRGYGPGYGYGGRPPNPGSSTPRILALVYNVVVFLGCVPMALVAATANLLLMFAVLCWLPATAGVICAIIALTRAKTDRKGARTLTGFAWGLCSIAVLFGAVVIFQVSALAR